MQLFYAKEITNKAPIFTFEKEESRHIIRVLRKQLGDTLLVTNGKGQLFELAITIPNDKRCQCEIVSVKNEEKTRDYHIHVAIAPTKNNDRLEWFLEKATELGIAEITPIICQQSERKIIKKIRLEKVVISAMKQSLQLTLPKLNDAISFKAFLKNQTKTTNKFIAHCEDDSKKQSLKNLLKPKENCLILIGPEGDFSLEEIALALGANYQPISLGNTRLRTETAGIQAVAQVHFINE
jgi:16S rRNA (uracil1498-N3)-methyltransferase